MTSAKPNTSTEYSGILAKNRPNNRIVEWKGVETKKELQKWLIERENALFDHFEISNNDDPDRWRKLAVALARKHVPAYKTARGRPSQNMFLDQGLAHKFHFLKLKSKRTDASIYTEITSTSGTLGFDAKERLKAYKKNFRDEFNAAKENIEEMVDKIGIEEASVHVENGIIISLALHQQAQRYCDQIDQWPHVEELF